MEEWISGAEAIRRSRSQGGTCVELPWDPDLEMDLTIECVDCYYHPHDYYYVGEDWRIRLIRP